MSKLAVAASVCALLLLAASSSFAQVIYEPVQYQYYSGGRAYYYGGSDPIVHVQANLDSLDAGYGRTNGYAFHAASIDTHREVNCEPTRVYSDAVPYWNARIYGYTIDDARNAAYADANRFFRKADVVRMARVEADGTWTVPANATPASGTIDIRSMRPAAPAMRTVEPKPILIIPKRLLDKPLWPKNNQTADAR